MFQKDNSTIPCISANSSWKVSQPV